MNIGIWVKDPIQNNKKFYTILEGVSESCLPFSSRGVLLVFDGKPIHVTCNFTEGMINFYHTTTDGEPTLMFAGSFDLKMGDKNKKLVSKHIQNPGNSEWGEF